MPSATGEPATVNVKTPTDVRLRPSAETNHERKKTPMSDPAVQAVELVRPCSKCDEPYTSHITAAMLGTLERAGVRPEEVVEAVERGALRWEITCSPCAVAASN